MDRIHAIIDAQGFMIGGEFYIRELVIRPRHGMHYYCCDVNNPIDYRVLNDYDKKTVDYCTHHVHGLPYECSSHSLRHDEVKHFIQAVLKKDSAWITDCYGVKNKQLSQLLKKWKIPFIDLDTLGCPRIDRLTSLNMEPCHRHKPIYRYKNKERIFSRPRCAKVKSKLLHDWFMNQ